MKNKIYPHCSYVLYFLNTPHPAFRYAKTHPLPQGERDSYAQGNTFLYHKENIANTVRTTSPLVGEVARRAGEGYFKILQTLKSWLRLIQRSLIIILPLSLSGCMGIYEGGFECPAGTGVGCKSISEVNEMIERGVLPHNSSISASDFESHTPKCESCGRSFTSNQEKAGIWINPLYLKDSASEMQTQHEEIKKNFIEPPHKHINQEFKREKGHHDTISL